MKNKLKERKGITLIALVITIIVLLILAGVSIAMLTGENGILTRAKSEKTRTENASAEEKVKLAIMGVIADDGQITVAELKTEVGYQGGKVTGDTFPVTVTMDGHDFTVDGNGTVSGTVSTPKPLPEGLEIGSTVKYTPSGTYGTYNWKGKYCSYKRDTILNSAESNFKISEWKVLDIANGKVTLVPTSPTTGTVYLGEAQGYNNGVKLLNDACNNLYGNAAKGITARSLNIEDIEKYTTEEAVKSAHEYSEEAKYGEQVSSAYTDCKKYPIMYAKENLSVINGESKKEDGIGMSEQTEFVEKTENEATDGEITTATSIQPYQTYWFKNKSFMQTAFKTATNGTKYYDLIMPKGSNTSYWLASRCVDAYSGFCTFGMRWVSSGFVSATDMYDSSDCTDDDSIALFPAVSLSSDLISRDGHDFTVDGNGTVSTPKPLQEGLEIGSTVAYTPSGTYNWQGKYCSTSQNYAQSQSDKTLNSAESDFKISEWRVLDIANGKVTLVPTSPTKGEVYLGQAQGYNNGVKLLNDACNSLYGNAAKGITARSLNIEDIEKYMTEEAVKSEHEASDDSGVAKYGEQVSSAYTSWNDRNYPIMYAKENLSVINGGPKKEDGIGMSEQTEFVEQTENGGTDGKIRAATSIQPYQTSWYTYDSFMQTAFKIATNGTKYYDLIMPEGSYTAYWLASRCVNLYSSRCTFEMNHVDNGRVSNSYMYGSDDDFGDSSLTLFPAVSLSSDLISGNDTNGFTVQ